MTLQFLLLSSLWIATVSGRRVGIARWLLLYWQEKNRFYKRSGQAYDAPIGYGKATSCILLRLYRPGFLVAWRLYYLPGLQARSTDLYPFRDPVYQRPDSLQVRVPPPFSQVMGVGNIITKGRFLAANLTYFCHLGSRFLMSLLLSPK
jgi:hypothetical protein